MGDALITYSIFLSASVGVTLLCVGALLFKRSRFHPNQYLLAAFLLVNLVQPVTGYILLSEQLAAAYPWVLRLSIRFC